MRPRRLLLIVFLFVVAHNSTGQVQSLPKACDTADAVVIGSVESVSIRSSEVLFALTIDTVVKGGIRAPSSLSVLWPGSVAAARMRPTYYRALWFLRQSGSGTWQIVPIGGPNAPIYASALAVPPGERLDGGDPSNVASYGRVWAILKKNAKHVDESPVYFTAMEALLRDSPSDIAPLVQDFAGAIQEFSKSASVNLKGLALASGIRAHDLRSLGEVATEAVAIARSPSSAQVSLALNAWRSGEPSGIASLGGIAQLGGVEHLSRPAANALMMIHTKEAVPHLVKLLAVKDASLVDMAVRGLSLFVNGAPILSATNLRSMAYLAEQPAKEFLDDGISPYVTVTPVPPTRLPEYGSAWLAWWSRVGGKWQQ